MSLRATREAGSVAISANHQTFVYKLVKIAMSPAPQTPRNDTGNVMKNKQYCVYILTNSRRTVLYTGVTNNLERRIGEHQTGFNETCYTHKRRPIELKFLKMRKVEDERRTEKHGDEIEDDARGLQDLS